MTQLRCNYGDSAQKLRLFCAFLVLLVSRLRRVVIPDLPRHVTQRGNGRAQTFFSDDDHRLYLDLLGRYCRVAG